MGSGGVGGMMFFLQLGLFIYHLCALLYKGGDQPMFPGDENMKPGDFRCRADAGVNADEWRSDADRRVKDLYTIMVVLVVIDGLMTFGIACLSAGVCCMFGACCLSDGMQSGDACLKNCFTAASGILMSLLYLAQFILNAIVAWFWIDLSPQCRSKMVFDIHYYYDSIAFRAIFFFVVGIILLISMIIAIFTCCAYIMCPECCRDVDEEDSSYDDTTDEEIRVKGTRTEMVVAPPTQPAYANPPPPRNPQPNYGPPNPSQGYGVAPQPYRQVQYAPRGYQH